MKKTLAILLVLAMILSMIPLIGASAAGPCYVAGTFNSWSASANPMTQDGDTFAATIAISAGAHEFKVVNNGSWLPSSNIWFNADSACDATFIYNSGTNSIGVMGTGIKYYLRGSMNNWETTELTLDGSVYKLNVNLTAGKTYEFKVTGYSTSSWDHAWPSSNQSYAATETKEYTFIFDPASKVITVDDGSGIVPVTPDYAVAGSFNNWTNNASSMEADNAMTTADDNVYTATVPVSEAGIHGFKVVQNGTWTDHNGATDSGNILFYAKSAGTATITYTKSAGTVTVTGNCVDTDTYTVHAKIPSDWGTSASLWAWSEAFTPATNLFAAWPGAAMTLDGEWYTYEIPAWVNKIIVNNSDNGKESSTFSIDTRKDLWLDLTAASPAVSYTAPVVPDVYTFTINGAAVDFTENNGTYTCQYVTTADGDVTIVALKNGQMATTHSRTELLKGSTLSISYVPGGEIEVDVQRPAVDTYKVTINGTEFALTENEGVFSHAGTYTTTANGDVVVKIFKNGEEIKSKTEANVVSGSTVSATYNGTDITIKVVAPAPATQYYVAGIGGWAADQNLMTDNGNGTYSFVCENLQPNTKYEFKVTNGVWPPSGQEWSDNGSNFDFAVSQVSNATITFNPATGEVKVEGQYVTEYQAPPSTEYYVAGNTGLTGADWSADNANNKMTAGNNGKYTMVYENLQPNTKYEFKITDGTWDNSWGIGDYKSENYVFAVSAASSVTITFDPETKAITVTGDKVIAYVPEVTSATVVGSKALCGGSADWATENDGAMIKGNDGKFTKVFTNIAAGNYECKVLTDGGDWYPGSNVSVAVATNGSTVTITFDPAAGTVTASVQAPAGGDQGGGTVTPPPATDPVYIVAGTAGLCGSEWNGTDNNNKMEKQADGTYKKVFTNVPAGEHGLKVVKDGSTWIPDGFDNETKVTTKKGATVTVTFNPTTGEIKAVATGGSDQVVIDPNAKYYVAGTANLCGSEWSCDDANNLMTVNTTTGTYSITYKDLVPNTRYAFKVTNGTWDKSWPTQDKEFAVAAKGDVTITFNPGTGEVTLSANAIKYVPEIKDTDKLVVAGSAGLCGSEWNATDEKNLLVKGADGSYSITYKNVAKGDYELKVVLNGSTWIGGSDGNNVRFTVNAACDVTVSYTPAGGIKVTGSNVTVHVPEVPSNGDETGLMGMTIVMMAAILGMGITVLTKKKFF